MIWDENQSYLAPKKLNPTLHKSMELYVVVRAGFSVGRKPCTLLQVEMDCHVKPFS